MFDTPLARVGVVPKSKAHINGHIHPVLRALYLCLTLFIPWQIKCGQRTATLKYQAYACIPNGISGRP
jgi:hypothetical protein